MDQDMNSYLEQLRARTEKRLQNESGAAKATPVSAEPAPKTEDVVKPSSLSVDDIIKEADTLRYDLPNVSYDNESEKMMDDLVAWADREPTIPFEPVSSDSQPTEHIEAVTTEASNEEIEDTADISHEEITEEVVSKPEKKKFTVSKETEKKETVSEPQKQLSDREQRKRAREFRRALVEKENGSGRGLIGEFFYVVLFIILVLLTILAVPYLLQTIAGIKILDVEAIFDIVFGWISSKILH